MKLLNKIIFVLVIFLSFSLVCYCKDINGNLYKVMKPNDILIGTTRFFGEDWISANRASRAGVLYYKTTGKEYPDTYVYITGFGENALWYKYDEETDAYNFLKPAEVLELEREYRIIYYDNNKPVDLDYWYYFEDNLVPNMSGLIAEENFHDYSIKNINNSKVNFSKDYIIGIDFGAAAYIMNCPIDEEFTFDLVKDDGVDLTGIAGKYNGKCKADGIETQRKNISYVWGSDKDLAGRSMLRLLDKQNNYANGLVTLYYEEAAFTTSNEVKLSGTLINKDLVKIKKIELENGDFYEYN